MGQFDILPTGGDRKTQVSQRTEEIEEGEIVLEEDIDLSGLESKLPVLAQERDHANRFYYARKLNDAIMRTLGALDPSNMSFKDLLKADDIFATSAMLSNMGGRSIKGVAYPEGLVMQRERFGDELERSVDRLAAEGKAEEVPEDWRAEGKRRGNIREYQKTFVHGTNEKVYSINPDSEEGKIFLDRQKKFNSLWQKRPAA